MTLCVALLGSSWAGCVTDGRLTSSGAIVDDSTIKSGVVEYLDATLTYSFSGLAKVGSHFEMSSWLPDGLCRSGAANPSDFEHSGGVSFRIGLEQFRQSITAQFKTIRAPDKRTSVVFVGYHNDHSARTHAVIAIVSNFEGLGGMKSSSHAAEFTLEMEEIPLGWMVIRQIGSGSISEEEAKAVAEIAAKHLNPQYALKRAVLAVQAAAERERGGTVGKRCTSLWVARGNRELAVHDFQSDGVALTVPQPYYVNARFDDEGAYLVGGGEMSALNEDGSPIASRVEVVGMKRPCPCGSGKLYKNCHGKANAGLFGPKGAPQVKGSVYFKYLKPAKGAIPLLSFDN